MVNGMLYITTLLIWYRNIEMFMKKHFHEGCLMSQKKRNNNTGVMQNVVVQDHMIEP